MEARKFLTNFCDVVVLWWRHGLPQDNGPDLSGVPLHSSVPSSPLFSASLSPIFSALLFLPLFGLGIQTISFLPAVGAGFPPVTNFIQSYLHQFFDDSHGLIASLKLLRRPFD